MAANVQDDFPQWQQQLINNPRWQFNCALVAAQTPVPHYESSIYGETSLATSLIFPPEEGFLNKVQCRLGNFAHHFAGPKTSIRSSLGTHEARGTEGSENPDSVIAWTAYRPGLPADIRAQQIPVIVFEVKAERVLFSVPQRMEAELQMLRYLKHMNDDRAGALLTERQDLKDSKIHGVLIYGTRCYRYILSFVRPRKPDIINMDEHSPRLEYHRAPQSEILFEWLYSIRCSFVQNLQYQLGAAFREEYVAHEVNYLLHNPPAYESSLYWIVYDTLDAVCNASRWRYDSWLDRPQVDLRAPAPPGAVVGPDVMRTSFDFLALKDVRFCPDFIIVRPKQNLSLREANLLIEVKREDTPQARREVFQQLEDSMNLFASTEGAPHVPGLAILGVIYWYVKWQNDLPTIDWDHPAGTLTDLRTDKDIWLEE